MSLTKETYRLNDIMVFLHETITKPERETDVSPTSFQYVDRKTWCLRENSLVYTPKTTKDSCCLD